MYWVRILASLALFSLWIQMFFWFRLFDRTAQYVDLIIDTVKDISEFTILLLLLLLTFGTGVYMLQVNRYSYISGGETELIFDYGPDWETGMLFEAVFF